MNIDKNLIERYSEEIHYKINKTCHWQDVPKPVKNELMYVVACHYYNSVQLDTLGELDSIIIEHIQNRENNNGTTV